MSLGAISIWLGTRAMRWAKTGSIKNEEGFANVGAITLIVADILVAGVMLMAAPDLLAVEFQWLMAAGLITILLVWLKRNRKSIARPAG